MSVYTPSPLARKAENFAYAAHKDQFYGASHPYVFHLQKVVHVLRDFELLEDEYICSGWLHDVVEDTPISLPLIRKEFGEKISHMVWAVTGVGETRDLRNQCIYDKITHFPRAASLKVADRIANVEACNYMRDHRLGRRYARENREFMSFVGQYAPEEMQNRLLRAVHTVGELFWEEK